MMNNANAICQLMRLNFHAPKISIKYKVSAVSYQLSAFRTPKRWDYISLACTGETAAVGNTKTPKPRRGEAKKKWEVILDSP